MSGLDGSEYGHIGPLCGPPNRYFHTFNVYLSNHSKECKTVKRVLLKQTDLLD
jgi:hypothetical protein